MKWPVEVAVEAAKEAAILTLLDVIPSLAAWYVLRVRPLDALGLLLLLEAAALMLVGGALMFASSPTSRWLMSMIERGRRGTSERAPAGHRAEFYTMVGVIFFLEAMLLTVTAA